MSHKQKLLDWFSTRRTITPSEAMHDLGIYRLAARIQELREAGHGIYTERMTVINRDGMETHPARYHYRGTA